MKWPIYFSKAKCATVCFPRCTYGHTNIPLHLQIPLYVFPEHLRHKKNKAIFFALIEDSVLRISSKHHLAHPPGEVQSCVGWVHALTCRVGLQQEQKDKLCGRETVLEKNVKGLELLQG